MELNVSIWIFIVLLAVLSCLFSGNETSITALKPYQWLSRTNGKNKIKDKYVIKALTNYSTTIGSILIGDTICNIVCSSLLTYVVQEMYGNIYVALATGILSIFVLLFCEYLPKTWARKHAYAWINTFWWLIIAFYYLFLPICWVFDHIFNRNKEITASEKDINYLIKTIQKEGVLEKDEAILVSNALKFDDITIGSIMIRRFTYVNNKDSLEDIKKAFIKSDFSRIPVINANKKVVGFILSKDILRAVAYDNKTNEDFRLKDYLKNLHTLPDNAKLNDALRLMQSTNTHIIGVISSRTNKIVGIVTMEMVIEQLVGYIYDEKDKIKDIQKINNFTWIVHPDVNAYFFFNKHLNMRINNKKITIETYLKKRFKFNHNIKRAKYVCNKFSVTIVGSRKGKSLKYEINKI